MENYKIDTTGFKLHKKQELTSSFYTLLNIALASFVIWKLSLILSWIYIIPIGIFLIGLALFVQIAIPGKVIQSLIKEITIDEKFFVFKTFSYKLLGIEIFKEQSIKFYISEIKVKKDIYYAGIPAYQIFKETNEVIYFLPMFFDKSNFFKTFVD